MKAHNESRKNANLTALVTGVSSGIGRATAQLLVERGARVFGTARNPWSVQAIAGVELVRMDVTDDASVAEAVQAVLNQAGQIDLLVNNAGYMLVGAVDETSIEEARQQFDTNFFGVLRVVQAVLPTMRHQSYGRIVNISSVLGFLPAPYLAVYAASKHALEGYTESLDHEVRTFGIRALLVEPTFTRTHIGGNERNTLARLDSYEGQRNRVTGVIHQRLAHGDEPRLVAEVVYRAATVVSPRLRYPVGDGVKLSRLRRFVPARMFNRTFRKQFRLDEPGQDASRASKTSNEQLSHANDL